MENIEKEIKRLREEIERYNYYYYSMNESLISDVEYDKLLINLEKQRKPRKERRRSPPACTTADRCHVHGI